MKVIFAMDPVSDFIKTRRLTELTGLSHATLLERVFFTGLYVQNGYGYAEGTLKIKGELITLLKNVIYPDKQNLFPWILVDNQINAIGLLLLESLNNVCSLHTIECYRPAAGIQPRSMLLDVAYEN